MTTGRKISEGDLETAGFDEVADEWAFRRGVSTDQSGKASSVAIGILPLATSMGTSPGTILSDNVTAKQWFHELESNAENMQGEITVIQDALAVGLPDPTAVLQQLDSAVQATSADRTAVAGDRAAITTTKSQIDTLAQSVSDNKTTVESLTTAAGTFSSVAQAAALQATDKYNATLAATALGGLYFPGARNYVPQGVPKGNTAISNAGTGGTDGVYALGFTGGNFSVNPTGTFTVTGGIITSANITGSGLYIGASPTPPTPTFTTSAGLSGAVINLSTTYIIPAGEFYYTDHASNTKLLSYFQNQGNTAQEVKPIVDWLNWVDLQAINTSVANTAALVSPADILSFSDKVSIPKALSWRTTAKRLKRTAASTWAICATNDARIYTTDAGGIDGVMMHPAMTVRSGDWTVAPANSGALTWVTSNVSTGLTLLQSKGHTGADLFALTGGSGWRGVTTSTAVQVSARNLTVANATGSAKRVFNQCWLSVIPAPGGGNKTVTLRSYGVSGTASTNNIAVVFDETGTYVSHTVTGGDSLGGVELFETLLDGRKYYYIWHKPFWNDATTQCPRLDIPVGCTVTNVIHNVIDSPSFDVPPATPVFADGSYTADGIQLGTSVPLEAQERRAGWGRTLITNGLITPAQFKSTHSMGRQRKIEVRLSVNDEALDFIASNAAIGSTTLTNVLSDIYAGTTGTIYLGDGQFPAANFTDGTIILKGAHKDPARWPEIVGKTRLLSGIDGGIIDRVCYHVRTGIGAAPDNLEYVLEFNNGTMDIGEVVCQGAYDKWVPQNAVVTDIAMSTQRVQKNYYYRVAMLTGAGKTLANSTILMNGGYGGFSYTSGTGAAVAHTNCMFLATNTTTDAHILGRGVLSFDSNCVFFARDFVPLFHDFWQWKHELEVQTVAGGPWVPLSTSGLTAAQLPRGKAFQQVGTFNPTSGEITYGFTSGNPSERVIGVRFDPVNVYTADNKAGYQANFSFIEAETIEGKPGYETRFVNNTVWERSMPGVVSVTNPNIRIRMACGKWSGGNFTAYADGSEFPVQPASGPHSDTVQLAKSPAGDLTIAQMDAWIISFGGRCQGYLDNSNTNITSAGCNLKVGIFSDYVNGVVLNNAGSCTVKGVMLPQFSRSRTSDFLPCPALVHSQGSQVDARGLFVGSNTRQTTVIDNGGGSVLTYPPTLVACGNIQNKDSYTDAATDQPGVRPTLYDIVSADQVEYGMLKNGVNEQNIRLSANVQRLTGINLQATMDRIAEKTRRFQPLLDRIALKDPTHTVDIGSSTAVGTALTLVPTSTQYTTPLMGSLDVIRGGNFQGYFTLENGVIKVARALPANTVFALVTDREEYIRIWVGA